jgi:tetratricopeptide (TPR) repeat protein
MAYRKLALEYNNRRTDPERQGDYLTKAYRHRDRLTEVERYLTVGSYYSYGPKPDNDKAIAAYESLVAIQPTNAIGLNNAAAQNRTAHRYQRAEEYILRAVELPDAPATAFNILAYIGVTLGDTLQERRALHDIEQRFGHNPASAAVRVELLYGLGDADSAVALARRFADSVDDAYERGVNMRLVAGIVGTRGRVAEMRAALSRSAMLRAQSYADSPPLPPALDSALVDVWLTGDVEHARRTLDRALAAHPVTSQSHARRPYTPLVRLLTLVGETNVAKEVAALFDRDSATFGHIEDERIRHGMAGDIALAERRYDDAARQYRLAGDAPDRCRVCFWPYEAHAYDLAGKPDSAIAIFTRYLESGDPWKVGDPYEPTHLVDAQHLASVYVRLGELWEKKGDRAKAASYYARFVDLWKDADPELQPRVAAVRRRLAHLRA